MAIITEVGIYKDVPNEDYHASPGISNSRMTKLLPPNCPKMYWYEHFSGEYVQKERKYQLLGSLVHTLALEPKTFDDRYIIQPEIEKINKSPLLKDLVRDFGKEEGKALFEAGKIKREEDEKRIADLSAQFLFKHAMGKQIIQKEEYEQAKAMAESLKSHVIWKQLKIDDGGCVEYSLSWKDEESGALLRSRPDFFNQFVIVDIKTTKDCRSFSFAKSVADYAYHRQGAMACDGLTKLTGTLYDNVVLFVVSKEPPYLRRCYVLSNEALEQGRKEYKQAAEIYQGCMMTGVWEGYPEIIEDIDLPNWKYRSLEEDE